MRIAIVPNAFKGSFTAFQAAAGIERGLKKALPDISTVKIPIADGGDGTLLAIIEATGGRQVKCSISDPLGRKIQSTFGLTGDGRTAVIEMAMASGVALLKPNERNPMLASSRGTGELICAALNLHVKEIIVGIGGSATNDGGTGMARALGVKFFDARNRELSDGGGALTKLSRIDITRLDTRLKDTTISVACDVDNPLCGPRGAARVYSPQKGATQGMVKHLDKGLKRLATVIQKDLGVKVAKLPGAGAAGGQGAGLVAFLGARMHPGIDIVTNAINLESKLTGCDLVITGEGRLDGQTAFGKAPAGVARIAQKLGIPVIAICGSLGPGADKVRMVGIKAFFSALEESVAEEDLPRRATGMLERCAEQVGHLITLKVNTQNFSKTPVIT
ncbi:MAG TPA: glycerate kinase [Verrucomicrobiae bacterium]|nr:glycerate kinase [Verrucomicrobiae bacterium]